MDYRILSHGGEKISVIGLGAGSLSGTEDEMVTFIEKVLALSPTVCGSQACPRSL